MSSSSSRLGEYLEERVHELGELGGVIQEIDVNEFGDSAAIHAFIAFGPEERGLLTVFEFVRMEDDVPRTRRYAYQGACDGDFLFRFDFDPIAHADRPAHKHVHPGGEPVPWQRVTLETAAGELQAQVAARTGSRN